MNLWAKGTLGRLAMLAVASFFFSCQDDTSIIGYKNPNNKFNVAYREFTPGSSVLLLESFRTSNFNYPGEENRLMVGMYNDERFGEVRAGFFSQYFTTSFATLPTTATYDSASLELSYDFYTYGEPGITQQSIRVYNLSDTLSLAARNQYYNSSTIPHPEENIIGQKTFNIDATLFKGFIDTNKDTTLVLKMPLDYNFGNAIFGSAIRYSATTNPDTTFRHYSLFRKVFKGIAVMPVSGDKIIRFNPAVSTTRLILHYHTSTADSLKLNMHFSGLASFNQILANRGGSEVAEVTVPFRDYKENEPNRYIQSGAGIVTTLDLSEFLAFADTIPNLIINSAELVISDIQTDNMAPPPRLALRVLGANNRPKVFTIGDTLAQDLKDLQLYKGYLARDVYTTGALVYTGDGGFYAVNDVGTGAAVAWSEENKTYSGHITQFLQELQLRNGKTRYSSYYLLPIAPLFSKSVNRVVIPADKIKLKVYYTIPTTDLTD